MEIVEGKKLKSKRFYVMSLGLGGLSGVGLSIELGFHSST